MTQGKKLYGLLNAALWIYLHLVEVLLQKCGRDRPTERANCGVSAEPAQYNYLAARLSAQHAICKHGGESVGDLQRRHVRDGVE